MPSFFTPFVLLIKPVPIYEAFLIFYHFPFYRGLERLRSERFVALAVLVNAINAQRSLNTLLETLQSHFFFQLTTQNVNNEPLLLLPLLLGINRIHGDGNTNPVEKTLKFELKTHAQIRYSYFDALIGACLWLVR